MSASPRVSPHYCFAGGVKFPQGEGSAVIHRKKNNLLYGDNCLFFVSQPHTCNATFSSWFYFSGHFWTFASRAFSSLWFCIFPLCRASFASESFLFLAFVRPSSTKLFLLVFSLFLAFRRARPNKEFASTAEIVFYSHFFLLVVLAVLNIFVVFNPDISLCGWLGSKLQVTN